MSFFLTYRENKSACAKVSNLHVEKSNSKLCLN